MSGVAERSRYPTWIVYSLRTDDEDVHDADRAARHDSHDHDDADDDDDDDDCRILYRNWTRCRYQGVPPQNPPTYVLYSKLSKLAVLAVGPGYVYPQKQWRFKGRRNIEPKPPTLKPWSFQEFTWLMDSLQQTEEAHNVKNLEEPAIHPLSRIFALWCPRIHGSLSAQSCPLRALRIY